MAFVAVLFLASFRPRLKIILLKCMGFVVFRFSLRRFGKFFHFSQKFQFFSNINVLILKKMVTTESFGRGIFGLLFFEFFSFALIFPAGLISLVFFSIYLTFYGRR